MLLANFRIAEMTSGELRQDKRLLKSSSSSSITTILFVIELLCFWLLSLGFRLEPVVPRLRRGILLAALVLNYDSYK
jgi:hypothetical protein